MYSSMDSYNYNLDDYRSTKCGNSFKVFGKGTVSVRPDTAEVLTGVITENQQLEAAQEENAAITTKVINSIIEIGVLPKNIQTASYNIRTNYDYINGKQVFRGYEVNNSLNILITNINDAGKVIDTAVSNGANTVSSINFIVSDKTGYYYQALSLAVTDAQNKAGVMADKLKTKLNNIPIQINEQYRSSMAPLQTAAFKSSSVATPIEAGENKITAEIEAIFVYMEY